MTAARKAFAVARPNMTEIQPWQVGDDMVDWTLWVTSGVHYNRDLVPGLSCEGFCSLVFRVSKTGCSRTGIPIESVESNYDPAIGSRIQPRFMETERGTARPWTDNWCGTRNLAISGSDRLITLRLSLLKDFSNFGRPAKSKAC